MLSRRTATGSVVLVTLILLGFTPLQEPPPEDAPRFKVHLTEDVIQDLDALELETPVTGRVFVIVTRDGTSEPREQVGVTGVPFWGLDVHGLSADEPVTLDPNEGEGRGYPVDSVQHLPPGTYYVQALLNVYTTFRRADGHTVAMHLNAGAGQNLWRAPGNVRSTVQRIHLDSQRGGTISLALDTVIPPTEPLAEDDVLQQGNPPDTDQVKFVKIESEHLSAFWGRPMYVGANVLLPRGYDDHPEVRYPALYLQGHFPGRRAPFGFGESGRGAAEDFTAFWNADDAPRMIAITFRDANPYYDTSYSVDSENVGPYGTAITEELIPYLEEHFRIIRAPWAHLLAGGSTGGWEALAMQVLYPDLFGGTWSWCPDPVDFHYYQIVNIYEDDNAYVRTEGDWVTVERPNARRPDGNVVSTVRQENDFELASGPNNRSGGQWDIWEAVFSPVAADGFPRAIWDPITGDIDREVATYWRDHYDLHHYLRQNWSTVGPKLQGKIHIATGDMDTYYLEEAVYLLQDFLESTDDPPAQATFDYGRREPHCWIGESPNRPGEEMSYAEFVQIAADYLDTHAPEGADRTRWRY